MHTYYEVKDMLKKELDTIVKKGELSAGSLETVDKLLNSIKNACKITMYEEYNEEGGYSQAQGNSGGNYSRRRDSMGRYSREGYSSRGGSRGYSRNYSNAGYSYGEGNDEKVELLRELMQEASSEDERRVISKLLRRMENE